MTIRYCGPGGSDANSGLSYASRKLTLNGIEDTPVVAGDVCYIAPGVYRELLTVDVSGTSGNPITYIGDVSGEHTDGVGGPVRVTGSDNDQTATRANCITATSKDYRTFRGFTLDTTTSNLLTLLTSCGNCIVEDCYFAGPGANVNLVNVGGTGTTNTLRRCVFAAGRSSGLIFTHTVAVDNSGHLVENCLFFGFPVFAALRSDRVGGVTVKHCTFWGNAGAVRVATALTVGQTITVNDCLVIHNSTGFQAATAPGTNEEITENYNALWGNSTDRSNVSTGANSNAYPPLFQPPVFLAGIQYPWNPFALSQWSPVRRLTGTGMAATGLYGITRPATDSKKSWGAVQYNDTDRETTTKRTGTASLKLADAGVHQMFVPTSNIPTTFSVYVQWEADYAGTKPQMTIKQPGQSDATITATGGAGSWELLTTTLTPAASPGYVIVELVSNNTAAATNYDVFFDDFVRTP